MQGNLVVKRLALPIQKLNCNPDLNVQCPAPKTKSEPKDVCERERSATARRGRPSAREKKERERDEGGERKRAKQELVVGVKEGADTSRSASESAHAKDSERGEQQQPQQRLEAKQKEKDAEGDARSTRLREQRGATSPNKAAGATSDAAAGTNQPAEANGVVTLEWPSARLLQALLSNTGWLRSVRLQLLVWTREVRIPTKMSHLDLSPDYRMDAFSCLLLFLLVFLLEHLKFT